MDDQKFKEYLVDRYQNQIDWYDKKSMWNQRWYKRLQWSLIILSALTPILITVEALAKEIPWLIVFPLVFSTFVAICTAALKSFKFQEHWIDYRTICETLRKEIHYYDALIGDYKIADDPRSIFINRVEGIISRENTMWIGNVDQKTTIEQKSKK